MVSSAKRKKMSIFGLILEEKASKFHEDFKKEEEPKFVENISKLDQ